MTLRLARDLKFLSWSHELNLYASGLETDANASFLLVHQALRAAFAAPLNASSESAQKNALRTAIDVGFIASQAQRASRGAPQ
jgi:hypothetical protein